MLRCVEVRVGTKMTYGPKKEGRNSTTAHTTPSGFNTKSAASENLRLSVFAFRSWLQAGWIQRYERYIAREIIC